MRVHAADTGVRDDERLRSIMHRHRVEEAWAVDVGQIDEDALLVQHAYVLASGIGQPSRTPPPRSR